MKNLLNILISKMNSYLNTRKETCRILEINLSKQEVRFQIKMKLPILKCSINQAINELNLVAHISAIEACYLGGYYGRLMREGLKDNMNKKSFNEMSFLLKYHSERCQIMYKNRLGDIGYFDKKLNKEFVESPLFIANNNELIKSFNSSQACYIGILAGLQHTKKMQKHSTSDKSMIFFRKNNNLRLVK